MALAVAEAQRVLRTGGRLLDIHPTGQPLRLEAWVARGPASPTREPDAYHCQVLGDLAPEAMVAEFIASNQALADAPAQGFRPLGAARFDFRMFFDTLDDLTAYLEDNEELDLISDDLLERALRALQSASADAHLVLVQPIIVTRLEKL